jgi:hypothetical protein
LPTEDEMIISVRVPVPGRWGFALIIRHPRRFSVGGTSVRA